MEDIKEISCTIETINKISQNKSLADQSCNELINLANSLIENINKNIKTIESLEEEIKSNDVIIEEYKNKTAVHYDIDDDDGFIIKSSLK